MSLVESLAAALGPQAVQQVGSQLGLNQDAAARSLQAALPALLGALQRNASQPDGAEALHRAVLRDHADADPMDRLMGMLGGGAGAAGALAGMLGGGQGSGGGGLGGLLGGLLGGQSAPAQPRGLDGGAILGHVFGQRQPRVERGVAQAAGIDGSQASQLLAMLAPMVMAALGRMTQQRGLDPGGLASALGQETQRAGTGFAQGGVLGSLLDTDGDGDVDAADLLKHGSSLFGAFMRR
ncbi:MAG: DUF937 domain-containing protein [Xanthomonadales bacterium]|nr:DUF937 domain-containing protein [Xanthomonadales bacterium]